MVGSNAGFVVIFQKALGYPIVPVHSSYTGRHFGKMTIISEQRRILNWAQNRGTREKIAHFVFSKEITHRPRIGRLCKLHANKLLVRLISTEASQLHETE